MQNRLLALGYWLPARRPACYDYLTQQAVYAFQKYNDLPRTGSVDLVDASKLSNADRPVPRSTSGYVIEIDKTRQVLIVANNGARRLGVQRVVGVRPPVRRARASATRRTRPRATFNVIRPVNGYDKSPLGQLYRPRYFTNTGIAVHGYTDVPPYPASHGCVRVSNAAMDFIWANNIMPIGADGVGLPSDPAQSEARSRRRDRRSSRRSSRMTDRARRGGRYTPAPSGACRRRDGGQVGRVRRRQLAA